MLMLFFLFLFFFLSFSEGFCFVCVSAQNETHFLLLTFIHSEKLLVFFAIVFLLKQLLVQTAFLYANYLLREFSTSISD